MHLNQCTFSGKRTKHQHFWRDKVSETSNVYYPYIILYATFPKYPNHHGLFDAIELWRKL